MLLLETPVLEFSEIVKDFKSELYKYFSSNPQASFIGTVTAPEIIKNKCSLLLLLTDVMKNFNQNAGGKKFTQSEITSFLTTSTYQWYSGTTENFNKFLQSFRVIENSPQVILQFLNNISPDYSRDSPLNNKQWNLLINNYENYRGMPANLMTFNDIKLGLFQD